MDSDPPQPPDTPPPDTGFVSPEAVLWCPVCSARLIEHRCKLACPRCSYYMSCADYY
jgi:hypothetical protein